MSISRNMVALSMCSKICQKSLADIFHFHKYYALTFINVPNARKRQQGSGKLMSRKLLLDDKGPTKGN